MAVSTRFAISWSSTSTGSIENAVPMSRSRLRGSTDTSWPTTSPTSWYLGPDRRGPAIVEAGFRDFTVTPSQGTHFFQNLTSSNVGYFTVNPDAGEGFVDWDWLAAQVAVEEAGCVRHLRFDTPIVVKMNGKTNDGVILKPVPISCSPVSR